MASYTSHLYHESGCSYLAKPKNISNSSSTESLSKQTPGTRPQVQLELDSVALAGEAAFSGLFPWVKHESDVNEGQRPAMLERNTLALDTQIRTALKKDQGVASFEYRDAPHLTQVPLLTPRRVIYDHSTSNADSQSANSLSSALSNQIQKLHEEAHLALRDTETATRSDHHSALEQDTKARWKSNEHLLLWSTNTRTLNVSNEAIAKVAEAEASRSHASNVMPPLPTLQGGPLSHVVYGEAVPTGLPRSPVPARNAGTAKEDWCAEDEVLDFYDEAHLPGYQVWTRGATRSSVMAIRVPRQMMGWKAVLMYASGRDGAMPRLERDLSNKARRSSKVLGKQGWEVRQEALKNSYDFRRGSSILATMHAGHRLFKHDWHIIVKDGSKYVWRMDKHELALYHEDEGDFVKVGEFCKAVPPSRMNVELDTGTVAGCLPDSTKRIGSFRFHTRRSKFGASTLQNGAIFDVSLAVASLVALFGARGGLVHVSAAFEPSSDPMRNVLEQQRQSAPDREQMMLALPRPGFARDTESVLSDTTDEDADAPTYDNRRPHPTGQSSQQSPSLQPTYLRPQQADREADHSRSNKGRKRFSSFFGKNSPPVVQSEEARHSTDDRPVTTSQQIARQYRTRSVMLCS